MSPSSRLKALVKVVQKTGCWEWQGAKEKPPLHPYGRMYFGKRYRLAHRVAYEEFVGAIPPGTCVLHRCDNPPCCNPEHLFLGTKADNNADRDAKGRTARGKRSGRHTKPHRTARGSSHGAYTKPESVRRGILNGRAKLSHEDVADIIRMRSEGRSLSQIANRFLVGISTVHRVVTGQAWQHVSRDNVISDGKTGYEGPLPANVEATLELLKKYGGE